MEKLKCIYIICFVVQLLSIPFSSYLFFSMADAKRYNYFIVQLLIRVSMRIFGKNLERFLQMNIVIAVVIVHSTKFINLCFLYFLLKYYYLF